MVKWSLQASPTSVSSLSIKAIKACIHLISVGPVLAIEAMTASFTVGNLLIN